MPHTNRKASGIMETISIFRNESVAARFQAVNPETGNIVEVQLSICVVSAKGETARLMFEGQPDFIKFHPPEWWCQLDAEEQRRKRGK
jgi:hypothetical protein